MKQARRKIERKDQQQSEENQSEGSEDDFYYPYFLQVFASHFTVFLPHEEDRFSFIYSLLESISQQSLKPSEEVLFHQEIIVSLCQNHWLMNELFHQWLAPFHLIHWKKDHSQMKPDSFHFDNTLSSPNIIIDSTGLSVVNRNFHHSKHNIAIISPSIDSGLMKIQFCLEEDRLNDEMTCFGICSYPIDCMNYEQSHCMWTYRCYNGECYCKGKKVDRILEKCHVGDIVEFIVNMNDWTIQIIINQHDYGIIFHSVHPPIHPFVLFYNKNPPQRKVHVQIIQLDQFVSSSESISSPSIDYPNKLTLLSSLPSFLHYITLFHLFF